MCRRDWGGARAAGQALSDWSRRGGEAGCRARRETLQGVYKRNRETGGRWRRLGRGFKMGE